MSSKSDTCSDSDKNNNEGTTTTLPACTKSQTTQLQCYCCSDDVVILSAKVDVLEARLTHFSK